MEQKKLAYWDSTETTVTELSIFRGNWDAYALANYLTAKLTDITVSYDPGSLHFIFDPSINIYSGLTTCWGIIGLPDGSDGVFTESTVPIDFSGVTHINVESNLAVNNVPINGHIGCIPVNEFNFGDMIQYTDLDGAQPNLVMDSSLNSIMIRLTDQSGTSLSTYLDSSMPAWQIILSIESFNPPINPASTLLSNDEAIKLGQTTRGERYFYG